MTFFLRIVFYWRTLYIWIFFRHVAHVVSCNITSVKIRCVIVCTVCRKTMKTITTLTQVLTVSGLRYKCLFLNKVLNVNQPQINLCKAVTWKRTGRDLNPQPFGSRANALPKCHIGSTTDKLIMLMLLVFKRTFSEICQQRS